MTLCETEYFGQTRCDLEQSKKDLLLLQDEVGKDLTPEYCEQCRCDIQEIAKSTLICYAIFRYVITSQDVCLLILGESSGDDGTTEQQKVKYFELKSICDAALQLQPFLSGTSTAMSILTGLISYVFNTRNHNYIYYDCCTSRQ